MTKIQTTQTPPKNAHSMLPRPKILIVDDKQENHRAVIHILAETNATFFNALSGYEALSLSLRHQFSVILLDVMMPVMDGYETAALMRDHDETKHIPIIFITAADRDELFEFKGYEVGAIDYLFKPINPHTLSSKVKIFIELDQQKSQLHQTLIDIKRLENRNHLLLTSIGEGILGVDVAGKISFSNPAAEKLLGFSEVELLNKNIMDLIYLGNSESSQLKWVETPAYNKCLNGSSFHETVGVFWNRSGRIFPVEYYASPIDDEKQFMGVVLAFQDITERRRTEEQLERLAQYDVLTGLVNRNAFNQLLEQSLARAKRYQQSIALLFIDLDRFKQVNDNLGHEVGDAVLQEVAQRLKTCVRDGDIISRLGGDEFTLILEAINTGRNAASVSKKIITTLSQPFLIQGNNVYIGVSIGIATYPDSASNPDVLLRSADIAMYQVKASGRNNYQFFTQSMQKEVEAQLLLENNLREALNNNLFILHYQPKVALSNSQLSGFEVLLRWRTDDGKLISPAHFIPKAEEMGLIVPIGEWVLREACRQMQAWRDEGLIAEQVSLAVNLSIRQLLHPDIVSTISQILESTRLPAASLELEVTESMMIQDAITSIQILTQLRNMGISIAVDDFGTGYSSLSYLHKLPIDVLKIDRSFVVAIGESLEQEAIIKTIISLAHSLNMLVVAEGVETEGQMNFLAQLNCDLIQGFYFSKPVSAAEVPKLLSHPFKID